MSRPPPPLPGSPGPGSMGPAGGFDDEFLSDAWVLPGNILGCRDNAVLPAACVCCGGTEGLVMKRKQLTWCPPVAYVGLLGGILPALILVAVLQKKVNITFGLCAAHQKKNVMRSLLAVLGILIVPLLLVVAAFHFESGILGIFAAMVFFGSLVGVAVVQAAGLRATHIASDRVAKLKGASPEFLLLIPVQP